MLFVSSTMFAGFSLIFMSIIDIWNLHYWGVAVDIFVFLVFYIRFYDVGTQIRLPVI